MSLVVPFGVYDETTGELLSVHRSEVQFQAYIAEVGQNIIAGHPPVLENWRDYYVFGGAYTARPTVTLPSASYDLTTLPVGTTITVKNEAYDELIISDLSETLTLIDPGEYWFDVEPPFPYMPLKISVEVL